MAAVLRAAGYRVQTADIRTGQDFLRRSRPAENIVTNPPYSGGLAEQFVRHALTLARGKVAMLLPVYFLETGQRAELLRTAKAIYLFSRRLRFPNERHCPFGQVWIVWERGRDGPPLTDWIE